MLLRDGSASEIFSIRTLSIVHLITRATYTHAQSATTTAVCGRNFDWMNNPLGQSPCLVASILQGACGTGAWTVPALPRTASGQQQAYLAPNSTNANACTCSAAVYNLMSACAACQDGQWLLFSPWGLYCSNQGLLSLPNSFPSNVAVPGGTTIPEYATTDPRTWSDGGFNVTEAQAIALDAAVPSSLSFGTGFVTTIPSVHSTPSSTTFLAASTNFNSSPNSTPGSSSNTSNLGSNSTSKKANNTGAIVGGVVGGLLGVCLIAVLLVWLLCGERIRHRQQRHANAAVNGGLTADKNGILERAFATPSAPPIGPLNPPTATPPPLANIVMPVAVRPPPITRDFPSYTSGGSTSIMTGSAEESNSNQPNRSSHAQKPSVTSGISAASVPVTSQAPGLTSRSGAISGADAGNPTLLQRLATSVGWRRHTSTSSNGSIGSGTVMTSTDLLSSSASGNTGGGANATGNGSLRGVGSRSRRGGRRATRSGSYSGGGGGIVLGEQDQTVLQNMTQHEANRIMANPVPFIIPSRPSSQAYDGTDNANGRNHDTRHSLDNQNHTQNHNGQPNGFDQFGQRHQNGHANEAYRPTDSWRASRGSYGLSASEEKRRLQKTMGRGVNGHANTNDNPPRYTQDTLPLTAAPDYEPGHELVPLQREPSLGHGSLGATLGSQSQLHLPSDEDARYEHFEHLSSPNPSNPPNPPVSPYPPNSLPPHSPHSPTSANTFMRQSSLIEPSTLALRSQDASSGIVDTSPTMMNMNTNMNTARNRPAAALRFTVTNPSPKVEM